MIQSSKDKEFNTLHDLTDFAFAKEVVRDFPKVISIYTKLLPVLYAFAQFQGVYPVIQMVEESKLLMEMQLSYYQKIFKTKGLVTDDQKSSR